MGKGAGVWQRAMGREQRVLHCVSGCSVTGGPGPMMGMWPIVKAETFWEITVGHCFKYFVYKIYLYLGTNLKGNKFYY